MIPKSTVYVSCACHTRVTITPADEFSASSPIEALARSIDPAEQKHRTPTVRARLERRINGVWRTVWAANLANFVAPVDVIVRDDGSHIAAFDDWGGMGYGPNTIVIYGPKGERIRALALREFLPAEYIEALPHSVSSINWRGDPKFSVDKRKLIIPVMIPSLAAAEHRRTVDIAIDLASGASAPVNRARWDHALMAARKVISDRLAMEKAYSAAFFAPLLGPKINSESAWHDYLNEAVARKIGDEETALTTVLREPRADNYAASEAWVRRTLTEPFGPYLALATKSERNLVTVVADFSADIPRNALANRTLFIAVSDRNWPAIERALRHSGAKLIQLDPVEPIAQRHDRITARFGAATQGRSPRN